MDDQKVIGIDIGGTKIGMGLVQGGEVVKELKLPTSARASEDEVMKQVITGIEQLITADTAGIGIGIPGLVDEEEGVVYDVFNIPSWKEVALKKQLEDHFKKPVYITNDANSFIIGEKMFGKAKAFKNAVGLTLGTGLGAGIIIGNKLYSGTLSSAGEFGCIPYLNKTLEDYCSGKFFQNKCGTAGHVVHERAAQGDEAALEILREYGHHIGEAIKIVLYTLSPEAVFLGGSVSSSYQYFKEGMENSIRNFPFRLVRKQLVVELSEVENVAVLGAVALFRMKNKNNTNFQMAFS